MARRSGFPAPLQTVMGEPVVKVPRLTGVTVCPPATVT